MEKTFLDNREISNHLVNEASLSEPEHVMWLNRFVSKEKLSADELEQKMDLLYRTDSLDRWIINWMIRRFYSQPLHPFVRAMQHPSRTTLLGYSYEHHFFLMQWVKSCACIISNTDIEEVQFYEIENILSEWYGIPDGTPSHHHLLLRMGRSYGLDTDLLKESAPLPATQKAIKFWDTITRTGSFLEGMSAMHPLEIIASRKVMEYGGIAGYFDPSILNDGSVTPETVDFLKEGYLADVSHSENALRLIMKYAKDPDEVQNCQSVFLKSMDMFSDYLLARLERGEFLADKQ